jgi:DNA-binding response OmpR family regulator
MAWWWLSGAEFRLLKVFLDHPNRVLNRDQLLELTQGRESDPFDRSVDIQISRLRQKLGDDARAHHHQDRAQRGLCAGHHRHGRRRRPHA